MSSAQDTGWVARYAAALGVNAKDVEEFASETDPRPADARTEPDPPAPTPQPNPLHTALASAFETIAADPALASKTKTAITEAVAILRGGKSR